MFHQGANCKVKDPRSGYEFDLTPLSGKDYEVKSLQYEYHFAVCGPIKTSVCPHGGNVSSCQVETSSQRISGKYGFFNMLFLYQPKHVLLDLILAQYDLFFYFFTGLANQNLIFDDGIIMINYTHGESCHKIYERSTAILFSCDHSKNPV